MRLVAILLGLALGASLLLPAERGIQGRQLKQAPVLIKAGRLLRIESGTYALDQGVLVKDGLISDIEAFDSLRHRNPSIQVYDLSRATLLPGLIDCHTHIFSAADGREDTTAKLTVPERILLGQKHAREYLESGVTTIRDLGHGILLALRLRDRIKSGQLMGAEIFAAGRKLSPPADLGPSRNSSPDLYRNFVEVAGGADDARRSAREVIDALRADVVKVVVNDGPRHLSLEQVSAIASEAHRARIKVAAHATSAAAIKTAVQAGVNSIEHGNEVTPELLHRMRKRGIFLVPNSFTESSLREIFAAELRRHPYAQTDFDAFIKTTLQQSRRRLRLAMEAKVRIAAGSDMIFIYPGKTRGEASMINLLAMHQQGMSAIEVIRAATINAAELLGISRRVGSLQKGKWADLIAVNGDPLVDLSLVQEVSFVMKHGVVIKQTN